jgi:hypothetical protein
MEYWFDHGVCDVRDSNDTFESVERLLNIVGLFKKRCFGNNESTWSRRSCRGSRRGSRRTHNKNMGTAEQIQKMSVFYESNDEEKNFFWQNGD